MCPINFVFVSCKVKKQESPEYYSVENSKTLGSHLNAILGDFGRFKAIYRPRVGLVFHKKYFRK